mmetsp:Transcript_23315/g.44504  ORF Transcript_23315/g.44504 Transcript_23315/m.44504 type:complete len:587 (-) Transcript_23315:2888-4648(-)
MRLQLVRVYKVPQDVVQNAQSVRNARFALQARHLPDDVVDGLGNVERGARAGGLGTHVLHHLVPQDDVGVAHELHFLVRATGQLEPLQRRVHDPGLLGRHEAAQSVHALVRFVVRVGQNHLVVVQHLLQNISQVHAQALSFGSEHQSLEELGRLHLDEGGTLLALEAQEALGHVFEARAHLRRAVRLVLLVRREQLPVQVRVEPTHGFAALVAALLAQLLQVHPPLLVALHLRHLLVPPHARQLLAPRRLLQVHLLVSLRAELGLVLRPPEQATRQQVELPENLPAHVAPGGGGGCLGQQLPAGECELGPQLTHEEVLHGGEGGAGQHHHVVGAVRPRELVVVVQNHRLQARLGSLPLQRGGLVGGSVHRAHPVAHHDGRVLVRGKLSPLHGLRGAVVVAVDVARLGRVPEAQRLQARTLADDDVQVGEVVLAVRVGTGSAAKQQPARRRRRLLALHAPVVRALPLARAVWVGASRALQALQVPGARAQVAQQQVPSVLARQTHGLVGVVAPGYLRAPAPLALGRRRLLRPGRVRQLALVHAQLPRLHVVVILPQHRVAVHQDGARLAVALFVLLPLLANLLQGGV